MALQYVRNLNGKHCERCGIELTNDNVSPSEIKDLCVYCFVKTKAGKYFKKKMIELGRFLAGR